MRAFITSSTEQRNDTSHRDDEPLFTIKASGDRMPRAFIVGGANTSEKQAAPGVGVSEQGEPTRCVASNANNWKAFIVGSNISASFSSSDEPIDTVTVDNGKRYRAFIVDDQNSGTPNEDGERGLTIRNDGAPIFTVSATQARQSLRAFVADGFNAGRKMTVRDCDEPASTVDAMRITKHPRCAWLPTGRVVAMTPRCLARFQSFPDSYILPNSNSLACRVIGNAVPPLLYQKVIEAQLMQ
jgi:site-specific DNA-cytosine methylase